MRSAESAAVNRAMAIGIVLIVLGILVLSYGGISYSHPDALVDVGGLTGTPMPEALPLPPELGGLVMFSGIALLLGPLRKS
jgi:hypothetical protein